MNSYSPHDLLQIDAAGDPFSAVLPSWAKPDWPVVVRRAPADSEGLSLAVGLRGSVRYERFPTTVRRSAVQACITPEQLLASRSWLQHRELERYPCLIALRAIADQLDQLDLPCGPSGGVGFALAGVLVGIPSMQQVLRPDSDLDLLLRADKVLTSGQIDQLRRIQRTVESNCCRADIQIDTGLGGFAFEEWFRHPHKVLLKTAAGPLLTAAPWQQQPDCAA